MGTGSSVAAASVKAATRRSLRSEVLPYAYPAGVGGRVYRAAPRPGSHPPGRSPIHGHPTSHGPGRSRTRLSAHKEGRRGRLEGSGTGRLWRKSKKLRWPPLRNLSTASGATWMQKRRQGLCLPPAGPRRPVLHRACHLPRRSSRPHRAHLAVHAVRRTPSPVTEESEFTVSDVDGNRHVLGRLPSVRSCTCSREQAPTRHQGTAVQPPPAS